MKKESNAIREEIVNKLNTLDTITLKAMKMISLGISADQPEELYLTEANEYLIKHGRKPIPPHRSNS